MVNARLRAVSAKATPATPGGSSGLCQLADGRLASGLDDGTIGIWDVDKGAETVDMAGHREAVTATCQLSDTHIASGTRDKTIRVWSLHTGKEICCLAVDSSVNCLVAARAC